MGLPIASDRDMFSDFPDACCTFLWLTLDYNRPTIFLNIYDPLSFVLRITPGVGAAAPFRCSMPTLSLVLWVVSTSCISSHGFVVLLADAPSYDTLLHLFEFY
jgi:hypothetical protein